MKHLYRIITMMILLLSIGTTLHAQYARYPEPNSDDSYSTQGVISAFKLNLKSQENLPTTDEETWDFASNYIRNLPTPDGYSAVIRYGDENTPALTEDETLELFQTLIDLVEQEREQRKQDLSTTPNTTTSKQQAEEPQPVKKKGNGIVLVVIIALVLAIAAFFVVKAKKKSKATVTGGQGTEGGRSASGNSNSSKNDIIIRQKTASVMYRQSLDDVVNSGSYLAVNGSSFSNNTAIKTMYIKNTCILDIYNMYADDLRNPNNPNEDGCMVVGRWIYDEERDEYSVSLEEIIKPGDDAVFAEYELDFGGKIKVKLNEKLRKLRRETDLQYDLTCWVHSHPGLGVFFSNTDCNLHRQHKHPTHPKFLTAIVIDILTPQQELGIFTFNHEMDINSRADLKQLFSLEEWYKWALESKRNAVIFEEHYNALENAKSRDNGCYNIMLSKSVIVDIDLIASNPSRNDLYFVHGFSVQQVDKTTNTADKIEESDTLTDNELVGCFVAVTHRSYPTIKQIVSGYLDKVRFVLVYSIADKVLTTIPVVSNDLCTNESYHGEQPLEELKIWTRTKR